MSVTAEMSWYLPCDGDGHWLAVRDPERVPDLGYLASVAETAERAGFDSLLVPVAFSSSAYGPWAPRAESGAAAAAAIAATRRIRVILAHRPGFVNPGVFALQATSLDRWSGGRLALNIVTAGAPGDMEQLGDVLAHDERYARAEEFVRVIQRLWTERSVDHTGKYFAMNGARSEPKPTRAGGPLIYLAGASEPAIDMAARQADVYMMSAETVEGVGRRIAGLSQRAGARAKDMRFCVAATMFARRTDAEARGWAKEFAGRADLAVLAERAAVGRTTTSVEDLRFRAASTIDSWLGPNLWSGMSHLAYGSAWVGSYEDLADLFAAYAEVGVSIFQIYGYPFLQEAEHLGREFLPIARERVARVRAA
ncbi:MAG: LLM class flavin-dependent oxidoreductase [Chloroflexi bacterium]|nr:LLM class flavin-dependent oxidoreductase [Chloroflexota bacterium]